MTHFEQSFKQSFRGLDTSLQETRQFLTAVLAEIGWNDREIDLQLAVGEVTQNIIRYGFNGGDVSGVMSIVFDYQDNVLTATITDNAAPVDTSTWGMKAEERRPDEGGYGLAIIKEIADEFDVQPLENGNVTRLVFSSQSKG